jgi:hypothetical protein
MEYSTMMGDLFDDPRERANPTEPEAPGVAETAVEAPAREVAASSPGLDCRIVPTDDLLPCPWPVRVATDPDADAELEQSIQVHGILVPLLVRQTPEGLEILAGMRRWQTARRLGLPSVPVRVCSLTERQARTVTVLENSARLGLSKWEEAFGLLPLLELGADYQEAVILEEICALTSWSTGKASSRRKIITMLTADVREKSDASETQMTKLSLAALERAASQESPDRRATVLYEEVYRRRAPWMDSTPNNETDGYPTWGRQPGYTFRTYERGRRLTLSIRPDSITEEEKPEVRRSLLRLLEALGSEFATIRDVVRASPGSVALDEAPV